VIAPPVAAAKLERMVEWRELWKSWGVSLIGNAVGCGAFALATNYVGLLTGGTAALCSTMAAAKCSATFLQSMFIPSYYEDFSRSD
jgi:formate/nitrite transporter FocA (FNT family)